MYYIIEEEIQSKKVRKELFLYSSGGTLIKKSILGYGNEMIYDIVYRYDEMERFLSYVVIGNGSELIGFRTCEYCEKFSSLFPVLDAEYSSTGEVLGSMKNSFFSESILRTDFFFKNLFLGYSLFGIGEEQGDLITNETYDSEGNKVNFINWQSLIDYSIYD